MIEPIQAQRVLAGMLRLTLPLALIACVSPVTSQDVQEEPPVIDFRAVQDALRDGKPGEPAFDSATKSLPDLILSESSWRVASGAFTVGEHGLESYVPHLLESLARKNQPEARDPFRARRAILDALLRLDADVPARLLTENIDANLGAVTYLLLARNAKANAIALRSLHDALPADSAARWAAACALTNIRDRAIAERLIAGIPWSVHLIVDDPGRESFSGRRGGGGHWGSPHGTWPPRVTYHLILPGMEDPLFPIPHTREAKTKSGKHEAKVYPHTVRQMRVRLLDELLGENRFAGRLERREQVNVTWTDEAAYKRDVEQRIGEMRRLLGRVAVQLEEAGLLHDAHRVREFVTFTVAIHDMRTDAESPLPAPPTITGVRYERNP